MPFSILPLSLPFLTRLRFPSKLHRGRLPDLDFQKFCINRQEISAGFACNNSEGRS